MYESPYQTTPASRFSLDPTYNSVRKLEINEELLQASTHPQIAIVPPGVKDFPPFRQVITRKEIPTLKAEAVIDGRSLVRPDGTPVKEDVYQHALLNAELTRRWQQNKEGFAKDVLNLGKFPPKIFAQWIVAGLANRLSLDFGQAAVMRALATVYYIQLHVPLPEHPTNDDVDRIILRAVRSLPGMDAQTLKTIVGEMPRLNTISDFIQWLKDVINTPRLDNLSVGFVYTALDYTFNPQFRELACVGLEYPPAFVSMVYSAINERGFTKFNFGKMIQEGRHQNSDKEFVQSLNHLLKRG